MMSLCGAVERLDVLHYTSFPEGWQVGLCLMLPDTTRPVSNYYQY